MAWFIAMRWDDLIGDAAAALVIALAAPLVVVSSALIVLLLSAVRTRSMVVRVLGSTVAALAGATLWYMLTVWACRLTVYLAFRLGFANQANNALQFFYSTDSHFNVVLGVAFAFAVVQSVRFRTAAA